MTGGGAADLPADPRALPRRLLKHVQARLDRVGLGFSARPAGLGQGHERRALQPRPREQPRGFFDGVPVHDRPPVLIVCPGRLDEPPPRAKSRRDRTARWMAGPVSGQHELGFAEPLNVQKGRQVAMIDAGAGSFF